MLVGVERQADRRDAGYAVAFEDAHQLALGRLEAGDEGLELLVLALILADRGERAAQIVGDRQDVARELGRGIGVRVGDLLVLAAGDVLRLGARIEQEIGRASCRGRVCQYVLISGVAGSLKKKEKKERNK